MEPIEKKTCFLLGSNFKNIQMFPGEWIKGCLLKYKISCGILYERKMNSSKFSPKMWNILKLHQTLLSHAETLLCGQASNWPNIMGLHKFLVYPIFFLGEWDEDTNNIRGVRELQAGTELPGRSLQLDSDRIRKGNLSGSAHDCLGLQTPDTGQIWWGGRFLFSKWRSPKVRLNVIIPHWLSIQSCALLLFQSQVDREDLPSKCKNVPHIDNILLAQLETQIEKLLTKQ